MNNNNCNFKVKRICAKEAKSMKHIDLIENFENIVLGKKKLSYPSEKTLLKARIAKKASNRKKYKFIPLEDGSIKAILLN